MYSTAGKCKPLRRKAKHNRRAAPQVVIKFLHSYIKKRVEVLYIQKNTTHHLISKQT